MEITDEIEQKDILSESKQEDIFYTLLNGKTLKETIETSRGKFVVKFPKQKDLMLIDRRVAFMRGGVAAANFDEIANFTLQKIAFLDVVIESGEKWFNNLKEKNENFTWGDMPDTDFVDEVYVKAWAFRSKVQSELRGHEKKADTKLSDTEDVSDSVDNGLFSGVAASSKRT